MKMLQYNQELLHCLTTNLLVVKHSKKVQKHGVRTIAPEKNFGPVRVRVWFRVRIRIRVGGQFSLGVIALEPETFLSLIISC